MKVTLYMSTTPNGLIARENDDVNFISPLGWDDYRAMVNRVGNLIVGRRTYELMEESGEFQNFSNIKIIVVTNDNSYEVRQPNHFAATSPHEALSLLAEDGTSEALLGGGGALNTSFAAENLIDEIYLDIEPAVFGKGIDLFGGKNFEMKLKLLETKKLSADEIQLHYKVLK